MPVEYGRVLLLIRFFVFQFWCSERFFMLLTWLFDSLHPRTLGSIMPCCHALFSASFLWVYDNGFITVSPFVHSMFVCPHCAIPDAINISCIIRILFSFIENAPPPSLALFASHLVSLALFFPFRLTYAYTTFPALLLLWYIHTHIQFIGARSDFFLFSFPSLISQQIASMIHDHLCIDIPFVLLHYSSPLVLL